MYLNPFLDDGELWSIPNLRLCADEDLSTRTSMKTQASAAIYAEPMTPQALRSLVRLARGRDWPLLVLGGGTNLIFATKYFEGIVVSLHRQVFGAVELVGENVVRVGAARQLTGLLKYASRSGLMGLEFCHKIPGTVGGALAGNAGAKNWGVCDFVENVVAMTRSGRIIEVRRGDFRYGYRYSELCEAIILEADFRLEPRNDRLAEEAVRDFEARKANQPYDKPSSGCIFKNPRNPRNGQNLFAGKLIDEAGLKGYVLNGAAISEGHANFIVNTGEASGEDFLALISLIQDVIQDRTGIQLQLEAQIVGGPLTSCVLH